MPLPFWGLFIRKKNMFWNVITIVTFALAMVNLVLSSILIAMRKKEERKNAKDKE